MLEKAKALVLKHSYEHRYPYDWRTKKPVIFRATYQWFANVEVCLAASSLFIHHRNDALAAIGLVG